MPRVLSYTPSWLTRPSPGSQVFSASSKTPSSGGLRSTSETSAPTRTIAHRGTEVFVAVGNEVRWTDLVLLKEHESDNQAQIRGRSGHQRNEDQEEAVYKILKVPISGQITQLVISPFEDYMAIVTTHTIHIAVLPDSSHLVNRDIGPLKLKTFQLGPTAHVLEGSPVASVLWHPLGQLGRCLVTITVDSVLRLWEINREDRWSFDKPSLSIDLKKLANATSSEQDLRASAYGASRIYSPDVVELEVAGACFGGTGCNGEHAWSAMTLWVATKEGELYALCPLLPSKWVAYPGLIRSLSTIVAAKSAEVLSNHEPLKEEEFIVESQSKWLSDLESQEPYLLTHEVGRQPTKLYSRPRKPGPAPKLQGPFNVDPDLPDDLEISDIVVRNVRVGDEPIELDTGEVLEDEEDELEPLGMSVICLLSTSTTLYVMLDLDGIEAKWLSSSTPFSTPRKGPPFRICEDEPIALAAFSIIPLSTASISQHRPSFTPDVQSPYAFFVTHEDGVSYFSMEKWVEELGQELEDPAGAGSNFRMDLFLETSDTLVEHLIKIEKDESIVGQEGYPIVSSCNVVMDSDVGYFVFTSVSGQPRAANLDLSHRDLFAVSTDSEHPFQLGEVENSLLLPAATREPYMPDDQFFRGLDIASFIKSITSRQRYGFKDQVRLSPATLEILMEAHRIFSNEAQRLGAASARLFRACGRLEDEYQDQIRKVRELAIKVDSVTGEDEDDVTYEDDDSPRGRARIEQRLEKTKSRQHEISQKYERVKKKLATFTGREMSDREKSWEAEVRKLDAELSEDGSSDMTGPLLKRFQEVQVLQKDLLSQAKSSSKEVMAHENEGRQLAVSSAFRRVKMGQVMDLLNRETAMVDSASERLQRLSVHL